MIYLQPTTIILTNFMPRLMLLLKKYNNYYLLLILISLFSCNNEDITKVNAISIKTIDETSEKPVGTPFVFKVETDTSLEISQEATYTVNDTAVDGNSFVSFTPGVFEVKSFYQGFESNVLDVNFVIPTAYSQKVLVEDYTGTWCGFCPGIAYAIEEAKLQTDKVISVAIHIRQNDPYIFDGSTALSDIFEIGGLPEGRVNRTIFWDSPQHENLDQAIGLTGVSAPLGLAIQSTINGNNIDLSVQVGFDTDYTQNLGVVVYLLENDLIYDQTNYTNLFPVGQYVNPLVDFEHNDVLRAVYTDYLGESIPSTETVADNVFTLNLSKAIPASIENTSHLHLIAFVVDKTTNTVINVQEAAVGEDKTFD